MSSIHWDDQQMVALLDWLEENITLVYGEVLVQSRDVPQEAFAAEVDLGEKQFRVFANPENPMVDTALNVFLGYILALAYDRTSWEHIVPSKEDLIDCHRLVCEAMMDFNIEFSYILEEHLTILELWRSSHEEERTTTGTVPTTTSADSLVDYLGVGLFGSSDDDDGKWRLN